MGLRINDVLKEAAKFGCVDCRKYPLCDSTRRRTLQRVVSRLRELAAQHEHNEEELGVLLHDLREQRNCVV